MSAIIEYLKLIPKGIASPSKIIEGIVNATKLEKGNLPQDELDEIIRRRVICEGCPFMSENATHSQEYLELSGKYYKTDRTDKHCALCACPIKTKTSSLSSKCGISYFNKAHKTNLPLKWDVYGTDDGNA